MLPLRNLPPHLERHRLLDTRESASFCGLSIPHWRRLYRAGRTTKPIRLSERKYGWRIGDLVDWIESRQAKAGRSTPLGVTFWHAPDCERQGCFRGRRLFVARVERSALAPNARTKGHV
jgi:predicted DNA-binding transcriptional regulator AlpA